LHPCLPQEIRDAVLMSAADWEIGEDVRRKVGKRHILAQYYGDCGVNSRRLNLLISTPLYLCRSLIELRH